MYSVGGRGRRARERGARTPVRERIANRLSSSFGTARWHLTEAAQGEARFCERERLRETTESSNTAHETSRDSSSHSVSGDLDGGCGRSGSFCVRLGVSSTHSAYVSEGTRRPRQTVNRCFSTFFGQLRGLQQYLFSPICTSN